jgi:hypothetical protein
LPRLLDSLEEKLNLWGRFDELTSLVRHRAINHFLCDVLQRCSPVRALYLVQTDLRPYLLLQAADLHRCNDEGHITPLLKLDMAEMVARLLSILQDKERKTALVSQQGPEAQSLIDLLQAVSITALPLHA